VAVDARAGPVYRPRMRWILVIAAIAMAACPSQSGDGPTRAEFEELKSRLARQENATRAAADGRIPAASTRSSDDSFKEALQRKLDWNRLELRWWCIPGFCSRDRATCDSNRQPSHDEPCEGQRVAFCGLGRCYGSLARCRAESTPCFGAE
jgi:hypothetical protein